MLCGRSTSPAMMGELTEHLWIWHELFIFDYEVLDRILPFFYCFSNVSKLCSYNILTMLRL